MGQFHHGPDGHIRITQGGIEYHDRIEAFSYDCHACGLSLIPVKKYEIRDYFINTDSGTPPTHAITKGGRQVPFEYTGYTPERFYVYIDYIEQLLQAKHDREGHVAAPKSSM